MTKITVRSNTNVRAIDVKWGKGSAFNLASDIYGSGYGAERYKSMSNKWKFMITSHKGGPWYQHYDSREFDDVGEMNAAIAEWIRAN